MPPSHLRRAWPAAAVVVGALAVAGLLHRGRGVTSAKPVGDGAPTAVSRVPSSSDPDVLRFSGTVEAVRASTIVVPRLAGQPSNSLVITHLVPAGTRVAPGDLLVEFDPQDQLRTAMDRRAEVVDLDGQIAKKRADLAIAHAADETAVVQAEHDLERARLDLAKNDFIPAVEAEKNRLAFEQNGARAAQLRETAALKQKAGNAEVRILEIRRERSAQALRYAERNTKLMAVHATFSGVAVIKSTWKGNAMSEVQEGEEVRPGLPILDIVDPSSMRVRSRVNEADVGFLEPGRAATIRLDAYPELKFDGRVEVLSPLGVASSMTPTVHTFIALVSIRGMHQRLMPDLTASVDVQIRGTR